MPVRFDDRERTDLFSFGAVLYEMCTGILPFRGDTSGIIIEAILNKPPVSPIRLNPDIPPRLEEIISKSLEKDRSLRYQHAVDIRSDLQRLRRDAESSKTSAVPEQAIGARKRPPLWLAGAVVGVVAAVAIVAFLLHRPARLTDQDTIVLADFTNTTGDPVFDGTLRRGLSVELEQSPFLSIVSDETIQKTLRFMGKALDVKLTPQIAREICQRTSSTAELEGTIALVGTKYDLTLRAVNCKTQDDIASVERQANAKDEVLRVLSVIASEIRERLGESPLSLQKYNTPLIQATTSSLEALQAYNLGWKALVGDQDNAAALDFFQRATAIDPNFATAFWGMCMAAGNLGESILADTSCQKAFDLREKLSEQEKLIIEASNYSDLSKAQRTYELAVKLYPRAPQFRVNLASIRVALGEYESSLPEWQQALRLSPESGLVYQGYIYTYLSLNRIEEAEALAKEARGKGLDSSFAPMLYDLAFYRDDATEMGRQAAIGRTTHEMQSKLLVREADTAAYFGKFRKSRELSDKAVNSATRAGWKEVAATYEAACALREALFGFSEAAATRVARVHSLASGRDLDYGLALALAYANSVTSAKQLTDKLARAFPDDTSVQGNYLPTLRAKLVLSGGNPRKAIDILVAAAPYEMGYPGESTDYDWGVLYPIYVRGEAYLSAHEGSLAAAEFQKVLDHRGIVLYEPIGALSRLQLGRAFAMQGDSAKAKISYQDFLTLWKDADLDIPILKQAKAEYAKLQ